MWSDLVINDEHLRLILVCWKSMIAWIDGNLDLSSADDENGGAFDAA